MQAEEDGTARTAQLFQHLVVACDDVVCHLGRASGGDGGATATGLGKKAGSAVQRSAVR